MMEGVLQRLLMQLSVGSQQSAFVRQRSSVCEQVLGGGGTHASMG